MSPTEQANVMAQSPALLQRDIEVATSVNQRLETIHQWITQSRASFSIEELRQSHAGMNLFVDDALPGIWDFKQDIVLLTDLDGEVIREVLRARGQSKFIWMTHSVPCAGEDSLDSSASDTLFVVEGQYPEKADIEAFFESLLHASRSVDHHKCQCARRAELSHRCAFDWLCSYCRLYDPVAPASDRRTMVGIYPYACQAAYSDGAQSTL